MPKPDSLRERPLETQKPAKAQWDCACAKCKHTWTSDTDELKCPNCDSDEGMCIKRDENGENGEETKKWDCACPHCGHLWESDTEFPNCPNCNSDDSECTEQTK
jgi:Zn finger protein HypA/HybF involved in hydrogenase expression